MLESDVSNPDSHLIVKFYDGTTENTFQSSQMGRKVMEDVVRVRINIPGNQFLELDEVVTDDHKARFPMAWAHYQNTKSGDSMAGTPIEELSFLSAASRENLKTARFFTVEQIANAGEQDLMRHGMAFGMASLALRDKCIRYLQVADSNSGFTQLEKKLEEAQTEKLAMSGMLQEMAARLEALEAKRDPGRPPKEKAA